MILPQSYNSVSFDLFSESERNLRKAANLFDLSDMARFHRFNVISDSARQLFLVDRDLFFI